MEEPEASTSSSGPAASTDRLWSGHRVQAGDFDGPLDLLLHLVRVNEVEITDIPIVEITEQYLRYLDLMRDLNLEVAGEYVVVAATLMHIKSQVLLPKDPTEDEEEDPRAELARQLLDYQKYKQAAENLQAMDSVRSLIWTREQMSNEFEGEELLAVDMFDLLKAFRGLLSRLGEEARLRLKRDNVSVREKITWLSDFLDREGSASLADLMESLPTRLDRIALFLAMLEMMRLRMIVAFQRKIFGEIRVALRKEPAEGKPDAGERPTPVEGGEGS
jgi:segregation and condensation protein A